MKLTVACPPIVARHTRKFRRYATRQVLCRSTVFLYEVTGSGGDVIPTKQSKSLPSSQIPQPSWLPEASGSSKADPREVVLGWIVLTREGAGKRYRWWQ